MFPASQAQRGLLKKLASQKLVLKGKTPGLGFNRLLAQWLAKIHQDHFKYSKPISPDQYHYWLSGGHSPIVAIQCGYSAVRSDYQPDMAVVKKAIQIAIKDLEELQKVI